MPRVTNRAVLLAPPIDSATRLGRERVIRWFEAALDAVDARAATHRTLLDLQPRLQGPVVVFAFGKAARGMAEAARDVLGEVPGVVIAHSDAPLGRFEMHAGGHPVPAVDAAEVGAAVLRRAQALTAAHTALCLVSGGGSAMLELPVAGLSIADVAARTHVLLRAGSEISEINAARAELSLLKGGKLALAMAPAKVVNVVLSDVAPHGPEVVASGPTIGPHSVTRVCADGATAAFAAARAAASEGVQLDVRQTPLRGEARELPPLLDVEHPRSYVAYGEPHVTVTGPGRGGRCRELALAALGDVRGTLLAGATDGVDGAPGAAGALVDPAARERAAGLGLDPEAALRANDSGPFFDRLGTAVRTGPTGTNVADLVIHLRG